MRQMMKNTRTFHLHPPHTQPPPPLHLRLPVVVNHPAHRASFVLVAERADILRWRSKLLLQGKGNRPPNAVLTRESGGRLLALRVTSVAGVRSPVGNHPQTAWIGLASELLQFFVFGNLIGSFPFLASVKYADWCANTPPNPVAGHAVDQLLVPVANTPTDRSRKKPRVDRVTIPNTTVLSNLLVASLPRSLPNHTFNMLHLKTLVAVFLFHAVCIYLC